MSSHDAAPSETSPLLSNNDKPVPELVEPGATGTNAPVLAEAGASSDQHADEENVDSEANTKNNEPEDLQILELRKRMKYIFPCLAIGVLLGSMDQTIIVSTKEQIGSDLNALERTSWIATGYFLTLTSFQPLSGKLSDIFGRKPCLLVAYTIFGIGCLGCGLAPDMNQLIAWRVFSGMGGGAMMTIVSIILSDIIPLRDRGAWQGYINIVYSTGAAIGGPIGGAFADGPGWRLSFLIQPPMCALAIITVGLMLKMPKKEDDTEWKTKFRRIDFAGAACLVSAVLSLLIGLDRGSNVSWKSAACLVPLGISFPLFFLFIYVEKNVAAEPFAPGRLLFSRSLIGPYLCNFFAMGGFLGMVFYVPLFLQAVLEQSARTVGLLLIPSSVVSVMGSLFAGFYMKKTGRYYWLTVICYAILTVGAIFVMLFAGIIAKTAAGMITAMSFAAFGNGIGVTSSLIAIISNTTHEELAVVTACSYLFRSLGVTTGVSLSAAVLNQVLRSSLVAELGGKNADKIAEGVRRSLKFIDGLDPEQQGIVRYCYMVAVQATFGFQVIFILGAAISAWFIKEKYLSR